MARWGARVRGWQDSVQGKCHAPPEEGIRVPGQTREGDGISPQPPRPPIQMYSARILSWPSIEAAVTPERAKARGARPARTEVAAEGRSDIFAARDCWMTDGAMETGAKAAALPTRASAESATADMYIVLGDDPLARADFPLKPTRPKWDK